MSRSAVSQGACAGRTGRAGAGCQAKPAQPSPCCGRAARPRPLRGLPPCGSTQQWQRCHASSFTRTAWVDHPQRVATGGRSAQVPPPGHAPGISLRGQPSQHIQFVYESHLEALNREPAGACGLGGRLRHPRMVWTLTNGTACRTHAARGTHVRVAGHRRAVQSLQFLRQGLRRVAGVRTGQPQHGNGTHGECA